MLDQNQKEHELIARNYDEAVSEVLKKMKVKIRQRQINAPNEPSLF